MAAKEKGDHSFLSRFARSFMHETVVLHIWHPRRVKICMGQTCEKNRRPFLAAEPPRRKEILPIKALDL